MELDYSFTDFLCFNLVAIYFSRRSKARMAGQESSSTGFTNQAYGDIDWKELRLQDL